MWVRATRCSYILCVVMMPEDVWHSNKEMSQAFTLPQGLLMMWGDSLEAECASEITFPRRKGPCWPWKTNCSLMFPRKIWPRGRNIVNEFYKIWSSLVGQNRGGGLLPGVVQTALPSTCYWVHRALGNTLALPQDKKVTLTFLIGFLPISFLKVGLFL